MKDPNSEIIPQLSQSLEIQLPAKTSLAELKLILSGHINYLIANDFNKLLSVLYKVDVSEKLLKRSLQEHTQDAATVIAEMIIERQLQKIKTREQFKTDNDIPQNEKW
jgi:hypothetical protein